MKSAAVKTGVVAVAVSVLIASCGGSKPDDPQRVLRETGARLDEIKSGTLEASFIATTGAEDSDDSSRAGFRAEGSFDLEVGELDVEHSVVDGDEEDTRRLIVIGEAGYIEDDDAAYTLPERLVPRVAREGKQETQKEVDVGDWFDKPRLSEGDDVDGEPTDVVEAELAVDAAINDLVAIAQDFGATVPAGLAELDADERDRLDRAVSGSSIRLVTGRNDRLLRELELSVAFEPDSGSGASKAMQALLHTTLDFRLKLGGVNESVDIEAPDDPRPFVEYGTSS